MMELPRFFKSKPEYKIFSNRRERREIYEFSKELSQYLYVEQIPNIVFLDRSARLAWIGVDEYWNNNYDRKEKPSMYFVNPSAFDLDSKVKRNLSEEEALVRALSLIFTGQSFSREEITSLSKEVHEEFETTYKKLSAQKDRPLVIFDNCVHSGDTVRYLIAYLKSAGYKDVRFVVADNSLQAKNSGVHVDEALNVYSRVISCSPFGILNTGVQRDFDVHSNYDPEADREAVTVSREEIRRIVKEKGA